MTIIDSYLDTLFAPYPDSDRMRTARQELRSMMEDKQHDLIASGATEAQAIGQVIAEFGNLDEVADVLGIQREIGGGNAPLAAEGDLPPLEMERATAYVQRVKDTQILTAISTPLFVLSPTVLLVLLWLEESRHVLSAEVATGIGLAAVLLLVAAGVLLGMRRDAKVQPFSDIECGQFTLTRSVRSYAQQLQETGRNTLGKGVAVALFILSPLCVILPPLLDNTGASALLGTACTLTLVAAGLFCWIAPNATARAAEHLIKEHEDQTAPENSTSPTLRVIASLWWPVTIAAFLLWGLGFDGWDRAWAIFPVSGILYGALWALNDALTGDGQQLHPRSRRH